jgi:hypothetical protein
LEQAEGLRRVLENLGGDGRIERRGPPEEPAWVCFVTKVLPSCNPGVTWHAHNDIKRPGVLLLSFPHYYPKGTGFSSSP